MLFEIYNSGRNVKLEGTLANSATKNALLNVSFVGSLDPVCEYHDEPRLEDHVVAHVHVLARHHGDRLPPGDPPAHVLLVLPPVHLPRLQRQQAYIHRARSHFVTAEFGFENFEGLLQFQFT